jgi:hypothetical protein
MLIFRNPAPVTPRSGFPRARLPSSEAHEAAASGAVSAGSNPVGAQLRGINSNTLTILVRRSPESVACGFATAHSCLPPMRSPSGRRFCFGAGHGT